MLLLKLLGEVNEKVDKEDFVNQISQSVDRRREQITKIRRIVKDQDQTMLKEISILMSLPILYANWEGFVKESLLIYLEYIKAQNLECKELRPALIAYALNKDFNRLKGNQNTDTLVSVTESFLKIIENPFGIAELSVDTKSNLKWKVLIDICDKLSIDISSMSSFKRKINSLVEKRNSIAHGGREPRYYYQDFEENASVVLGAIEEFERVLTQCVANKYYCNNIQYTD
jgi:MAE_28990/MAE_18760-like HEPN